MQHPLARLGLAGLALVSTLACDLSMKIDKSRCEALISSIFEAEKIKVDSISCPADQPAKKGHSFECTAKAGGVEVHFNVEVIDEQGSVMAKPRDHTIKVGEVEGEIASDLRQLGHSVASIDCHGEVWVSVPGAIATCDIVDEAGAKYLWTAEFTDGSGRHTHKIEPV